MSTTLLQSTVIHFQPTPYIHRFEGVIYRNEEKQQMEITIYNKHVHPEQTIHIIPGGCSDLEEQLAIQWCRSQNVYINEYYKDESDCIVKIHCNATFSVNPDQYVICNKEDWDQYLYKYQWGINDQQQVINETQMQMDMMIVCMHGTLYHRRRNKLKKIQHKDHDPYNCCEQNLKYVRKKKKGEEDASSSSIPVVVDLHTFRSINSRNKYGCSGLSYQTSTHRFKATKLRNGIRTVKYFKCISAKYPIHHEISKQRAMDDAKVWITSE